jgi:hypothetical protein
VTPWRGEDGGRLRLWWLQELEEGGDGRGRGGGGGQGLEGGGGCTRETKGGGGEKGWSAMVVGKEIVGSPPPD